MSKNTDAEAPNSLLVIGAGASAIKLAHTILSYDSTVSITILEANDYIGGRVRNFNFHGHTVEMGANWISGREVAFANPVWDMAKDVELKGHTSDRGDVNNTYAVYGDGKDVTGLYLDAVERFGVVYEKAIEMYSSEKHQLTTKTTSQKLLDESVRSVLNRCGWKISAGVGDAETKVDEKSDVMMNAIARTAEYNVLEVWVSDGLDGLSALHELKADTNDVELGQDEFFVEDSRGFNHIFSGMVRDLERMGAVIKLGMKVEKVQYTPGAVKVVARDVRTGELCEYNNAEAVVSTVSLGVLQSGSIEFLPPLPYWKVAAINEMGMFTFAKVYVEFGEEKFWPDRDHIVFVSNEDYRCRYPLWMRYRNAPAGRHIFMCYLGGAEAERVESLSKEEIAQEVEVLFRTAFQSKVKRQDGNGDDKQGSHQNNCFRPIHVDVTNWSRNPLFCGSYSYFPLGAFANVPEEDIRRSLTGREKEGKEEEKEEEACNNRDLQYTLHFAGEGFDDKFGGWVQGGYFSGERVAKFILGLSGLESINVEGK